MIETKRLMLRPFKREDFGDVFEYLHKPAMNCFMDMKLETVEDAKAEVERRCEEDGGLYLAICLKDNGKVIGEIFTHPEGDTFSPCWMINTEYQKQGYGFEAAYAFIDFLFSEKGARRVYAYTEDNNISCQKLCEKLGMRKEGLFVEFVSFVNDENGTPIFENTYQYAILKKEWLKNKG